jgi:hypothetical protein
MIIYAKFLGSALEEEVQSTRQIQQVRETGRGGVESMALGHLHDSGSVEEIHRDAIEGRERDSGGSKRKGLTPGDLTTEYQTPIRFTFSHFTLSDLNVSMHFNSSLSF